MIGAIRLSKITINGVVFGGLEGFPGVPLFGPFLESVLTPLGLLAWQMEINNTTNANQAIVITLGDTSFSAVQPAAQAFASGTFQSMPPMSGSVIGFRYFDDPANAQGATTVTDTPGNLLLKSPSSE